MRRPSEATRVSFATRRRACVVAWLSLALGSVASGCIDSMSVGLSPLATLDASVTAAEDAATRDAATRDNSARDASAPIDSGARAAEAGTVDAAPADATVRDAAPRDAQGPDTGSDASLVRDAGLEYCEEALCAIAGIVPRDQSCPKGEVSACLREESGQCAWYCL